MQTEDESTDLSGSNLVADAVQGVDEKRQRQWRRGKAGCIG